MERAFGNLSVNVEIVGEHLALVSSYGSQARPNLPDTVRVYEWKTGLVKMV